MHQSSQHCNCTFTRFTLRDAGSLWLGEKSFNDTWFPFPILQHDLYDSLKNVNNTVHRQRRTLQERCRTNFLSKLAAFLCGHVIGVLSAHVSLAANQNNGFLLFCCLFDLGHPEVTGVVEGVTLCDAVADQYNLAVSITECSQVAVLVL